MAHDFIWWKHGVFYQIYPRSFMDSNGDGVGDLQGIIDRLDYLNELGVDAIWISPIFPSPMADFGYDVSDYVDIHPLFGDLATFDRLLEEAHKRSIHVVLDYVPNHTSDEHPWFIESRSSRDNPKRDWYWWRDAGENQAPPNNWDSYFGGSAWEWDEATQQYYLHMFLAQQPDLNWHNPEVVKAMHDVLHFWLKRGVDGFRMDVVTLIMKNPELPDNPKHWEGERLIQQDIHVTNQPQIHDRIREFREIFDSYPGYRVIIGETWFYDPAELAKYYGNDLNGMQIPFNFITMKKQWHAQEMKEVIKEYYRAMPKGATPNFVLGSHDEHRLATRFGYENHRSAGLMLLTLWGIPTMYYGDEIGMQDVHILPEQERDPFGIRVPGYGLGRDPERTPMQWDSAENAGFTAPGVEPWLPIADDYKLVNVATQRQDPTSTLSFYKRLLSLRCDMPVLHEEGVFAFVEGITFDVLAYTRRLENERVLVVINFGNENRNVDLASIEEEGEVLVNTRMDKIGEKVALNPLYLRPNEGILLRV